MDLTHTADDFTTGARHDGWSAALKIAFLDHLAAKGTVRRACARAGMSHEAAYRLRRRDPLFARGWKAALALARDAGSDVLACHAIDGIEEQVWYRGELIGTRLLHDARLLLAHIARLDRLVEENPAGENAPGGRRIVSGDRRSGAAGRTGRRRSDSPARPRGVRFRSRAPSELELRYANEPESPTDEDENDLEDERLFKRELECAEEGQRAGLAAAVQWDEWFQRACGTVDGFSPCIVSTVSTSGEEAAARLHDPALDPGNPLTCPPAGPPRPSS